MSLYRRTTGRPRHFVDDDLVAVDQLDENVGDGRWRVLMDGVADLRQDFGLEEAAHLAGLQSKKDRIQV